MYYMSYKVVICFSDHAITCNVDKRCLCNRIIYQVSVIKKIHVTLDAKRKIYQFLNMLMLKLGIRPRIGLCVKCKTKASYRCDKL